MYIIMSGGGGKTGGGSMAGANADFSGTHRGLVSVANEFCKILSTNQGIHVLFNSEGFPLCHKKTDIEVDISIEGVKIGKFKNVDQACSELKQKGYTIGESTIRCILSGKYKAVQYSNWKVIKIN
jgi:hypothetical protein